MCKTQWVLAFLALFAGLAHSWDIAVSHGNSIAFYTNVTKSNGVNFGSQNLGALAYDGVRNMLLYVEKESGNDTVCGYFITDNYYKCYIERSYRNIHGLAFDPVTERLFFSDINSRSIYWFSLKTGFNENNVYGNLLINMDQGIPTDIAVDSCRGYVYWINTHLPTPTIERVHFDGSGREVIININSLYVDSTKTLHPHSLTIDQETQKIYWIEPVTTVKFRFYYTDLDGNNKHNLMAFTSEYDYSNPPSNVLTVSKTYLYHVDWLTKTDTAMYVRKYGKITYSDNSEPINLNTASVTVGIAANYEISLATYLQNNCGGSFCVHGTQVIGQLLCKCTPGYIGERCEVSVCDSYCIQGDCSFNDDGHPKCRCRDGYSGERCEVNECHGFCLNSGVCSLNEADEPSCKCSGGYEGSRCETVQNACKSQTNNIV